MSSVFGIIPQRNYAQTLLRRLNQGPVYGIDTFDPDTYLRIIVKETTGYFTLNEVLKKAPTDPSMAHHLEEIHTYYIHRYFHHVHTILGSREPRHGLTLLFQGILYNENWNYVSPKSFCRIIESYGMDPAHVLIKDAVQCILEHQNAAITELMAAGHATEDEIGWLIQDVNTVKVLLFIPQCL